MSAPFLDDAPHAQLTNLGNTSISYYPKGELIGMVMDLLVRGRTKGRLSLDDVMRQMYDEFYLKSPNSSYYLRGRGYQTEDLERVVSQVSGTDFTDFFKRRIRHGIEIEVQVIRAIDVVAARIPLVKIDATEVDHPEQCRTIVDDREVDQALRTVVDLAGANPVGPR